MDKNFFLIGGSGRSGTTILNRILAQHPQVSDVPEWRFLIDPDGLIDFYATFQVWSPYHYDIKLKRLESLLRDLAVRHPLSLFFDLFKKIGILQPIPWNPTPRYANISVRDCCPNFIEIVDLLIEQLVAFRYFGYWTGTRALQKRTIVYAPILEKNELREILRKFLLTIIESVLKHQGVTHYLEKNTWNILWYDKILELLPEARLVHIYRDPRDIVASYTRQSWMPADAIKSARIYKDIMDRWSYVRDRVPDDKYIEISLEALVSRPENVLRRICSFWDLPWNSCLLSTDLSKSNSGRWQTDLSPKTQDAIRPILSNLMKTLGYE